MLVLSRKPGEKICLGSDIVVTVLEIKGRQVRIGIDAPDRVNIVRAELPANDPIPPDKTPPARV